MDTKEQNKEKIEVEEPKKFNTTFSNFLDRFKKLKDEEDISDDNENEE